MGRRAQPWYRKSRDAWYVEIGGRQVQLARGKANKLEAEREFHRLMVAGGGAAKAGNDVDARELCRLYLDHIKAHRKPATYAWYLRQLKGFSNAHGALPARDVRPHHVAAWVDDQPWGQSTKAGAVRAVKAAFAWARKMGHLDADPIRDLPRRQQLRRTVILSPEAASMILGATAGTPLGDLLSFLAETGCRPGEAATITAADLDLARGLAVLREHKTAAATGKPRVIVLSATALDLAARLARAHPTGPIFRNRRGHPWTRHAMAQAFARLRRKLGMGREATAVAFRHRFATDLSRTQPNTIVAALLGHTSTSMVDNVYSYVRDEIDGPGLQKMREAVERGRHNP